MFGITLITSKFIKDLLSTIITQITILLLLLILMRLMASILDKEYFGVFVVTRRLLLLYPMVSLGLDDGLARYVSYKKEERNILFSFSLVAVGTISLTILAVGYLFRLELSNLFFGTPTHAAFIPPLFLFIVGYGMYHIGYSFFRGRKDMRLANRMEILYYSLPIIIVISLWKVFDNKFIDILLYYFWFYAIGEFIIGLLPTKRALDFSFLLNLHKWYPSLKEFFIYGTSRIPSSTLWALCFVIPVITASHNLSLTYAGYIGISISILRLMELVAVPIMILFPPRFAELARKSNTRDINHSIHIVLDFVFSFMPTMIAMSYGLSKYIVVLFFGPKYIAAVGGVYIIILCSFLYLIFIVIKGILDGLFFFPYVSMISLVGALVTGTLSMLFHYSYKILVLDLGIGLSTMGIISLIILLRKQKIKLNLKSMLTHLTTAMSTLGVLVLIDSLVNSLKWDNHTTFIVMLLSRVAIFIILLVFWNKSETLWLIEAKNRLRISI